MRTSQAIIAAFAALLAILAIALFVSLGAWGLIGSREKPRYTCAELLGAMPRPGSLAITPPGYTVAPPPDMRFLPWNGDFAGRLFDFSVRDERGRLVCDADGKDVKR